jgi:hypothetical protein
MRTLLKNGGNSLNLGLQVSLGNCVDVPINQGL